MQEHPVPQNVTGYEFHLIGQMTLKQFMEVAAGVVIAVLINWTNLSVVIKYPLMGISVILGLALAFIPLEGRPLDRWFFAFIKSIYQPTMFYWKKSDMTPAVFTYIPPTNLDTSPQVDYKPIREHRVQEFLKTLPSQTTASKDPEDIQAQAMLNLFTQDIPITQTPPAHPKEPTVLEQSVLRPTIQAKPVAIPVSIPVKADSYNGVAPVQTAAVSKPAQAPAPMSENKSTQNTIVFSDVKPTQTSTKLPFPNKPKQPNMIVGMVVTSDEKIIENAIVTINRKSDGTPVRALKSNALGQFGVVTPLESGEYILTIEKEGFHFENTSLALQNQIIDPLLLKAKA